jgi:hypothetical protein
VKLRERLFIRSVEPRSPDRGGLLLFHRSFPQD